MEILIGEANPDTINVSTKNGKIIYKTNMDEIAYLPIPFIYGFDSNGEKKIWVGKLCETHKELIRRSNDMASNIIDGRLWDKINVLTFWQLDRGIVQKNLYNCISDLAGKLQKDLSNHSILYNTNKNIVKCISVNEFFGKEDSKIDAKDTSKERE